MTSLNYLFLRRPLVAVLIVVLCLGGGMAGFCEETQPREEDLASWESLSMEELKAALAATRQELNETRVEYRRVHQRLVMEDPRAREIQAEIRGLTEQIRTLNKALRDLLAEDEAWAALVTREEETARTLEALLREQAVRKQQEHGGVGQ